MIFFTKEEYLGAIFKLKILAGNKTPIGSTTYRLFNLGICSRDLLPENRKFRTKSQFCPLDLGGPTKEPTYKCSRRCAFFDHNYPVEQIYKLIEDFEVKD